MDFKSTQELNDYFKSKEDRSRLDVTKPIVIRVDMRAGHTFTKHFKKPFDQEFSFAMQDTAVELGNQVTGTKIVYTGSDEISLILFEQDSDKEYQPMFGGYIQKLVSSVSALATQIFNDTFCQPYFNDESDKYNEELDDVYMDKLDEALFDARAFNIESDEINLYLQARIADVRRNSISATANAFFKPKELLNKNSHAQQEMLKEINIHWDEYSAYDKYGELLSKELVDIDGFNPQTMEFVTTKRRRWVVKSIDETNYKTISVV